MPEWVRVVHASSPDAEPAVVTKDAFEQVMKANGWRLFKDAPKPEVSSAKSKSTKKAR